MCISNINMKMPKFPDRVLERKKIAKKLLKVIDALVDKSDDVVDGGTLQYWIKKAIHEICPEILWANYDWLNSDDLEVSIKE